MKAITMTTMKGWATGAMCALALVSLGSATAATPADGVTSGKQPLMRVAFNQLNKAKAALQTALHNKGGHRVAALALVERALAHVKEGAKHADKKISLEDVTMVPQPKMKAALGHLGKAHAALKSAAWNKGGHRIAAIPLVKQAIEQVEKGIAAGNK